MTTAEAERIKTLWQENREVRRANEMLSAAAGELSPRSDRLARAEGGLKETTNAPERSDTSNSR
jgi:transposase-like protein